jgi:hypothetical protein
MTRTQAANAALALVNLGYAPRVVPSPTGDPASGWKLQVSPQVGVAASTVANFATSNGLAASVLVVEFS